MRRSAVAVITLCVLSSGCGDAFGPSSVAGRYTLRSVNGVAIPTSVNLGQGITLRFDSSIFTLNEDLTWLGTLTVTATDANTSVTETTTGSGTYQLIEPNTIRFTENTGDVLAASFDNDRFTIIQDGQSLVYEK